MPDAQTEQEAPRMLVRDPVVRRADRGGVILPDVEDPGGDSDLVRRVEDVLDNLDVAARGPADPDSPVTERFHFSQYLRGKPRSVPPDADLAEFDAHVF